MLTELVRPSSSILSRAALLVIALVFFLGGRFLLILFFFCPDVSIMFFLFFFFFQAEDGIRDTSVTGVQTCALPILAGGADIGPQCDAQERRNKIDDRGQGRQRQADRPQLHGDDRRRPRRRPARGRSEERRVGKECRSQWSANT